MLLVFLESKVGRFQSTDGFVEFEIQTVQRGGQGARRRQIGQLTAERAPFDQKAVNLCGKP